MATSNGTGADARPNPTGSRPRKGEKRAGDASHKVRKAARPPADDRSPEAVAAALHRELLITLECNRVEFTGTAQQLIDEGVLPADFVFPEDFDRKEDVDVPGCSYAWVKRARLPGTGEHLKLVDRWIVQAWMPDNRRRRPYSSADQWADLCAYGQFLDTPAGRALCSRWSDAHLDRAFQAAMNFKALRNAVQELL